MTALAIFVKTPGLSPIKTRLATAIGTEAAIEFHRLAAAAVAAVVRAAIAGGLPLTPCWAVAEPGALDRPEWRNWPRLAQGEGELGKRLDRIYSELQTRHGRALLIGADAPQLTADLLAAALAALEDPATPFAIGRAHDGGFWLFGGRAPVSRTIWTAVRYSQPRTADELHARLLPYGDIAELPRLADVDTVEDLPPLRAALAALPMPLPEQRALLEWIERAGRGPARDAAAPPM